MSKLKQGACRSCSVVSIQKRLCFKIHCTHAHNIYIQILYMRTLLYETRGHKFHLRIPFPIYF